MRGGNKAKSFYFFKVFDFMFTSQHYLCRFTPLYNIQQFSFSLQMSFLSSESEVVLFS